MRDRGRVSHVSAGINSAGISGRFYSKQYLVLSSVLFVARGPLREECRSCSCLQLIHKLSAFQRSAELH